MPYSSLSPRDTTGITGKILTRLPFVSGVNISLHDRSGCQQLPIDSYIHSKLNKRASGNVQHIFPHILSLHCNDRVFAAAGIRLAESGPLHLEKRLRLPVEQEIGMHFKTAIPRGSIVEIGNVVSTWTGSDRLLFILLFDFLSRIDRKWAILDANPEVGYLLKKMDYTLLHSGNAAVDMTGKDKDQWKKYIDDKPETLFCYIPAALSVLRKNVLMDSSLSLFSEKLQKLAEQWRIRGD